MSAAPLWHDLLKTPTRGKGHKKGSRLKVLRDGTRIWFLGRKAGLTDAWHRGHGPAIEYPDGTKHWYQRGKLHRDRGPAMEHANGTKSWWRHGLRHRVGGPAIEWSNGSREWYVYGKRHRDGGPAVINDDGSEEWWSEGVRVRGKES